MTRYLVLLLIATAAGGFAETRTPATETTKPPSPPTSSEVKLGNVKLKAISDDRSELMVLRTAKNGTVPEGTGPITIAVAGQALKDSIKNWRAGDLASVTVTETTSGQNVTRSLVDLTPRLAKDVRSSSPHDWVLPASFGLGLALWIWQRKLIVGQDKRYSNSKVQIALWFTIVIVGYLATLFVRGHEYGTVNIPTNLLLLSGLSVITFGGAQLITQGKVAEAAQKKADNKPTEERTMANEPNAAIDFVTDAAGKPDLGDFQMIVITILAAIVYLVQLQDFVQTIEMRALVSLPDVDNTLLASFGLGHGAYLVKKATGGVNQ